MKHADYDAQIGDPARETELVDQLLQGDVRRFRDGRLEMPK